MMDFTWLTAGLLGLEFAAGIGLGLVYFGTLWWTTQRLCTDGHLGLWMVVVFGRLALLVGALYLASQAGALSLLAMAAGVLLARTQVQRLVRAAGP